jgi:uncharacterized protein (DUF1499 family)
MGYRLPPLEETSLTRPVRTLALLAVPTALVAVFTMRAEQLSPPVGFALLGCAGILAAFAIALGVVGMLDIWQTGKTGLWRLFRFGILAACVLAVPGYFVVQGFRLPPLTDVTTDLDDPPAFLSSTAAIAARGGHLHPMPDKRMQAMQARAYPALRPILLDMPDDEAQSTLLGVMASLKWQILVQKPAIPGDRRGEHGQPGRIEAVVQSPILRLKHDIVVRLQPDGGQTRIDIRAASRFGRHDLGANAALILRLQQEIKEREE